MDSRLTRLDYPRICETAEEKIPDREYRGVVRIPLTRIDRMMDPMNFRRNEDAVREGRDPESDVGVSHATE